MSTSQCSMKSKITNLKDCFGLGVLGWFGHWSLVIGISLAGLIIPHTLFAASTAAEVEDLIAKRNGQIQALENLINAYEANVVDKRKTAGTLKQQIDLLSSEITKTSLEIRSLSLAINKLGLEIRKTQQQVALTQLKIDSSRDGLRASLANLARSEREDPLAGLVKGQQLSSFFNELYDLYFLQSTVQEQLDSLKKTHVQLATIQDNLEDQRGEQEKLKRLEEEARVQAESKKQNQKQLLTKVKKEETTLVNKIKVTKLDIAKIKEEISYLIRAGVSVEEAIRYGQLAAIRLGIRPAFLLGLLEIESKLGLNVGKGTWKKDMAPRDYDAFISITSKLNLDPDKTPVSKKPGYGWGGAMGPAQFIPTTWLGYEAQVARLTGHNPPSPWNIEDAFTAAAIKLAGQGAAQKTREGEMAAAKAYISGSASCTKSICNYYARAVLDKASQLAEQF